MHGGPLGCVGDNDMFVVQVFQQCCKFIDVHVSAGFGSGRMLVLVECALCDQDFALGDIFQLRKIDVLRIAKVGYNRNLQRIVNFLALFF